MAAGARLLLVVCCGGMIVSSKQSLNGGALLTENVEHMRIIFIWNCGCFWSHLMRERDIFTYMTTLLSQKHHQAPSAGTTTTVF
jgi:hypothetical protein